jgi:hypothetical protein
VGLVTAVAHATELDRAAPAYEFRERHSLGIRATPERIHDAIMNVTADEIFLFGTLIWIRRLGRPLPPSILNVPKGTSLHEIGARTTFITLADSVRELVSATVVGRPKGTSRPRSADELLRLRTVPGHAIATMSWTIEPQPGGTCLVTTETRVHATDAGTRRRFAAYWFLIRAGSGFIRRMWLRAVRRRAEAARGQALPRLGISSE